MRVPRTRLAYHDIRVDTDAIEQLSPLHNVLGLHPGAALTSSHPASAYKGYEYMLFIGLDLAWSPKNQTGAAVIEGDGQLGHLVSSALLRDDDEIVEFIS